MKESDANPFAAPECSEVSNATVPSGGFGCLTAILGALSGLAIGSSWESRIIAAMRAKDPSVTIDFLPVLPFFGFVFGGILGLIAGKVYCSIATTKHRTSRPPKDL